MSDDLFDDIVFQGAKEGKLGNWIRCEKCGAVNHASNKNCFRCGKPLRNDGNAASPSIVDKGTPPAPFGASRPISQRQETRPIATPAK